jgi:hypothetical protein
MASSNSETKLLFVSFSLFDLLYSTIRYSISFALTLASWKSS